MIEKKERGPYKDGKDHGGAVEMKVKMACESTPEHGTFGSSDLPID